ncbi:MAG: hypothetical protein JXA73_12050 [Acidobacteria bacterium]|nr:hypothetical protein [Acidobacteriota bacterium]
MKRSLGLIFLFFLTSGIPAFAQLFREVVFPRFVSGDGWSSEFFFSNHALSNQTVYVYFYDKDGNIQSVDTNLGSGTHFTFQLKAGGTQVIDIDSTGDLKEGYVVAKYPTYYSPITASQVYRYEANGVVQVEVGVSQQEFGQHFSFAVEKNIEKRIYTAISFSKPASFSINSEYIIVTLIDTEGTIQATKTLLMKAGEHIVSYIDQEPLFSGLGDFRGSINISSVSGIAVLILRQDKNAFGAVPTDRGPMVGAFKSTLPAVQEVEPNNNEYDAHAIPGSTLITGNITVGDLDAFMFTGKAGDILTIIADTSQVVSDLDPVIELYRGQPGSQSNPVAYIAGNDQNGLEPATYNLGDAFFQMVLPEDDTYFISIYDYYQSGGTNYNYMLHVSIQ